MSRSVPSSAEVAAAMQACLAAAGIDSIEVVKIAVSESFNVVAVRSTDPAIDGARICRTNLLDQRVNKALGIPPPKFVTWTEDRVRLVRDIFGKSLFGAAVSFDEGAIEIVSKVGSPISEMRIRVVEEVIGCKVHVRPTA